VPREVAEGARPGGVGDVAARGRSALVEALEELEEAAHAVADRIGHLIWCHRGPLDIEAAPRDLVAAKRMAGDATRLRFVAELADQ
jgi:hypothetical protein